MEAKIHTGEDKAVTLRNLHGISIYSGESKGGSKGKSDPLFILSTGEPEHSQEVFTESKTSQAPTVAEIVLPNPTRAEYKGPW